MVLADLTTILLLPGSEKIFLGNVSQQDARVKKLQLIQELRLSKWPNKDLS